MNNLIKKIVAIGIVLTCAVFIVAPVAAEDTVEDLTAKIAELEGLLKTYQEQVAALEGTETTTTTETTTETTTAGVTGCTVTSFGRNLSQGMSGDDVKCLQIVLNSDPDTQVAASGVGSSGEETTYFGSLTKAAVIKFQEKYADEVLAEWGLTSGTGYVGSTTITKLDSLLGAAPAAETTKAASEITSAVECVTAGYEWYDSSCHAEEAAAKKAASEITDSVECVTAGYEWYDSACHAVGAEAGEGAEEGGEETGEVTAGLTAALADDTPAPGVVPAGATNPATDVVFTKVKLTAVDGSASVTKIVVTRGGVSRDLDVTGVKLYDGVTQLGTTQTFNAQHQAVFTLSTPLVVEGTKTLTIAADLAAGTSGSITLGIYSPSDITSDATINGTFPIIGNPQSESPTTNVGNIAVDTGSLQPPAGGTIDVGVTNQVFMQAKFRAGSVEDVNIEAITVARGQNASFVNSDITNITLYNDTAGAALGTVASLDANSKAVFDLRDTPVSITRGGYVEISVRADVVGGSTRAVAFDINDGVAWTVQAKGASYGYGVAVAAGTFAGIGPATTINRGTLTVSKGANCPATGNIPVGASDVKLGSFDFAVLGEQIRIGQIVLSVLPSATGDVDRDLSMVRLLDSAGNTVAGPVDPAAAAVAANSTVTFTPSLTLSPGTNELTVVATVDASTPANATYQVGFSAAAGGQPSTAITNVRGITSNLPLTAGVQITPAANILGNVMTAQTPVLGVDVGAAPVAGNVIIGSQDYTFANIGLDATAGGEDIRVSSITVTPAVAGGAALANLANYELWEGSTQIGKTEQLNAAGNVVFSFSTPYVVSKNAVKVWALKADLVGGTAGGTLSFTVTAASATGKDSGVTLSGGTLVLGGSASPLQAEQVSGDLRVTVDASPVTSAQLVAATANNEVIRYKFWAADEDVDVTRINVCAGDNTQAGTTPASAAADIAVVSLWDGSTQLGPSVPVTVGAGNAITASSINIPAGDLVVPKNGTKLVTMKVTFNDKTLLTSGTDYQFGICSEGAGGAAAPDNDDVEWGAAAAAVNEYSIVATGRASGLRIDDIDDTANDLAAAATGQVFGSNVMEAFDGKLTVALNSASPTGSQTPGANKTVLLLDLTAEGDDITVTGLTLTVGSTSAFDGVADTVSLTNSDGTVIYDTTAAATDSFDTGNTIVFPSGAWTNALVIAAGTTQTVAVVGDTTGAGAGAATETLQLSIVNPLTDITWTDVSGGGPTAVGTKTVPLYGNTISY